MTKNEDVATPGARPYHHGNLRRALLDAAERTLRERGVDALSLRELAREAGVSHGAPRRHFADRQALLDALAESGFERLGFALRTAVRQAGPDFVGRLRAAAAEYARFAIEDAALLELMFAGKHRDGEPLLHDAIERAFSVMVEVISQGQTEGFLEPGDPARVGLVLFATVHGLAALVVGGMVPHEELDQLLVDGVEHFLRGSRTDSLPSTPGEPS